MSSFKDYLFTVPAGQVRNFACWGQVLRVQSLAGVASVIMKIEPAGVQVQMAAGQKIKLPAVFNQITIDNTGGGVDATLTVLAGVGDFEDQAISGSVTATIAGTPNVRADIGDTLDSKADDSIAAAATEVVSAAAPTRRRICVINLASNVGEKRIGDAGAGAANGFPLQPGEFVWLETTAAVSVYNAAAVAESVALVEELD